MAAFPTNLGCTITAGYGEQFPKTKQYLGGSKYNYNPVVKVAAQITSHADMEDFTRWYITDIDWGTAPFTISLPLFGVIRNWNVQLTNTTDVGHGTSEVSNRKIPMVLEVLDNIDDYINP